MNPILDRYTYRVTLAPEDTGEFVATCAELPSLSWLAADRESALQGIVDMARVLLKTLEPDEAPPQPLIDRVYSGEIRVRIPPAVHERLAKEASELGISLNAVIIQKLRT